MFNLNRKGFEKSFQDDVIVTQVSKRKELILTSQTALYYLFEQ